KWIWEVGNGSLSYMNLSCNHLTGFEELYSFPDFSVLDLHFNNVSGAIPSPPQTATYVDYSENRFDSPLPENIGINLTFAYFFSVSNNLLAGAILKSICNATYLRLPTLIHATWATLPTYVSLFCEITGSMDLSNVLQISTITGQSFKLLIIAFWLVIPPTLCLPIGVLAMYISSLIIAEWNFLPFLLHDSSWLMKLPGASSIVSISNVSSKSSSMRLDCSSFFDGHLFAKCPYSYLKHSTLLLS
ncbi:receptor-like protein 12, partial [Tanacetum coccineum]